MSLKSQAQAADEQLFVVDPTALMPLEVSVPLEEGEMGHHDDHEAHHTHEEHGMPALEVSEPVDNVEIVVSELPGAPDGTHDPEPLEVAEAPMQVSDMPAADDASSKKKDDKWDWSKHGPHGFVAWVQEKISSVPKHSGYDSAGLERAMAYMERLDSEISKAMRMDMDEELDANKIEEVRNKLDEGISRLQSRLDKVKETKKSNRKRKKSGEEGPEGLVKEAQKILGVQGVYIMAPLLIASIARICINGMVSAGHDIEDLYARQVKQWKLTDREQFELRNLLFDMGVPMRADRGAIPDEPYDTASSDNMDWAANFTDASQSWRR
jgi:hypothetical protein